MFMLGGLVPEAYHQIIRADAARGLVDHVVAGGPDGFALPVSLYVYMELCLAAQSILESSAGRAAGEDRGTSAEVLMACGELVGTRVAESLVKGLDCDRDTVVSGLVLGLAHFSSLEEAFSAQGGSSSRVALQLLDAHDRSRFAGEAALQLLNRSKDEGHIRRLLELILILLGGGGRGGGAIYSNDAIILVDICVRELAEEHSTQVVSNHTAPCCAALPTVHRTAVNLRALTTLPLLLAAQGLLLLSCLESVAERADYDEKLCGKMEGGIALLAGSRVASEAERQVASRLLAHFR